LSIEWSSILEPQTPLLETITRGTLTYLALFFLMRGILKRQSGAYSLTDLLVVVLIADAAQNAMADDYRSVPDGIVLVATIILWSWALDWLGYRFPVMGRLVHPPPLELVRDGIELRRNMARELITHEELMTQLRNQGVEELSQVKRAQMEGNGVISVVTYEHDRRPSISRQI
jgi:uncharacterized membrane protein YcaP (DUF421 family)